MKLYGTPPTRAVRPLWLLNELDLPCELVALNPLEPADRAVIEKVNPSVKLPVLVDGSHVQIESVAIMLYLAERYGEVRFIPNEVRARALMHQWNLFLVTEIEQPLWRMSLHTVIYPKDKRREEEVRFAAEDCRKELARVEAHLVGTTFFVGSEPTVADFNAAYVLDWADDESLLGDFPNCREFVRRMYDRPTAPVRISEGFAYLNAEEVAPRHRRDVPPERRR